MRHSTATTFDILLFLHFILLLGEFEPLDFISFNRLCLFLRKTLRNYIYSANIAIKNLIKIQKDERLGMMANLWTGKYFQITLPHVISKRTCRAFFYVENSYLTNEFVSVTEIAELWGIHRHLNPKDMDLFPLLKKR